MKRIGIMSMQRIKNYGSFLQAYGLKKILEEMGHEVQFVDYHVGLPLVMDEKIKSGKIKKIMGVMHNNASLKHKIQFIKHKKEFQKYFSFINLSEKPNYNPKLDTLIIGSDEVFNCVQKNHNVGYSLELFGKDNNASNLITYAASFGNTTIEKLNKYGIKDEIAGLLNNFNAISVRDTNSGNIVSEITRQTVEYNLDPVLIYDYMNKCEYIPKLDSKEEYIIVYAYNGRISKKESKYIKEYSKKMNYKIYSIGGAQECADKFINCNPFEVLAYFKNAKMIITDTFHGSIFSIITKNKFVTLVRKSYGTGYGNEEKITDLLTRLKLEDRIVYNHENIESIMEKKIDYSSVEKILELERIKAVRYLEEKA